MSAIEFLRQRQKRGHLRSMTLSFWRMIMSHVHVLSEEGLVKHVFTSEHVERGNNIERGPIRNHMGSNV